MGHAWSRPRPDQGRRVGRGRSDADRRGALAVTAVVLAAVLALAGCGQDGDRPTTSTAPPSAPSGAPTAAAATPSQTPDEPLPASARLVSLSPALVTRDVGMLTGSGVRATVFNLPLAPTLGMKLDVVRNKLLRDRAQREPGQALAIEQQVLASSPRAVLVQVAPRGSARASGNVTVAYDVASNQAYTSAALIDPRSWTALSRSLAAKKAEVAPSMKAAQWPWGAGPSLAFGERGDLVVTFPAASGLGTLTVGRGTVEPWLSPLGRDVLRATTNPTLMGTRATFRPVQPSRVGGAQGERPTLVVGPDCSRLKCVALTFDDGPGPGTTEMLVTLTSLRVPATFMVVGAAAQPQPQLVTQQALAGMHVASHSQSKPPGGLPSYDDARLRQDLTTSSATLRRATGQQPFFLRPPGGLHDGRVDEAVGQARMIIAQWDVDSRDWELIGAPVQRAVPAIVQNVQSNLAPGSIILMHDMHTVSRESLPHVVDLLQRQGYVPVTLTELAGPDYGWGQAYCAEPRQRRPCF